MEEITTIANILWSLAENLKNILAIYKKYASPEINMGISSAKKELSTKSHNL